MSHPLDLLIKRGTVYDGCGGPPRQADVGICGGRIAEVGSLAAADTDAAAVVDASGCIVCPGFIDVHSHSDAYLLVAPDAPSKIRQGVTTEIIGQCGCSAAPLTGGGRLPADWLTVLAAAGVPLPGTADGAFWQSVAAYREVLGRQGHGPNVVMLAGHGTLRAGLVGYAPRSATADECAALAARLEKAIDEGASGFSTGLIYQPGRHAQPEEVHALATVAAAAGGVYASHLRSEGGRLLEALEEFLEVGRRTGVALQVSHLKTSGPDNWHKIEAALGAINGSRQAGLAVHGDRYPYVASGTDLDVLLPEWAANGGREAVLQRVRDPRAAAAAAEEMLSSRPAAYWQTVVIGATWHPVTDPWRGHSVDEAAAAWGLTAGAAVMRFLALDELRTGAFFFGMSATNMRRIYREPWVMVGSDASVRSIEGPLAADHPHPRAYGAFATFLGAAREQGPSGVAEAIRRMTRLPADAFGLAGRGRLQRGAWADVAVIDLERLAAPASYAQPHAYAEGVRCTIVNGRIAFDGRNSIARPGQWLTTEAEG